MGHDCSRVRLRVQAIGAGVGSLVVVVIASMTGVATIDADLYRHKTTTR